MYWLALSSAEKSSQKMRGREAGAPYCWVSEYSNMTSTVQEFKKHRTQEEGVLAKQNKNTGKRGYWQSKTRFCIQVLETMSSYHEIILQQVVPALGVLTGTFMSFAPYRAVLQASRDGHLGDLNPTPWVFMLGNCVGWLAYSYLIENVYVFLPNASGLILAIWLNVQAIKLQYENHRSAEMQNAIIAALEDHSKKTFRKSEVETLVETVIAEETVPPDLLRPISTAPVVDDEHGGHQHVGHHSDKIPSTGTLSTTYMYETISSAQDIEKQDDGGTTVFEDAAEAIVDWTTFIWDITAQKSPAPASHELMVIAISILWLFLISIAALGRPFLSANARVLMIGVAVNLNLVFFYGAPLSKIVTVLETKCCRPIHISTMIASLLNGTFWFSYGIAVNDGFIFVPNGFGALLGVIQLILCLVFPRQLHKEKQLLDGNGYTSSFESTIEFPDLIRRDSAPII